jgi:pyridoxine/pyridoxamine 5'-phosphate oxidase
MTRAELFEFISGCKLAVLGSVSPEGVPQSARVGIAVIEELEIVFDTLNTTRKFRNLTANCRASFVIGWPGITYFVVRRRWIRYSDFDQRPPLVEEHSFGG